MSFVITQEAQERENKIQTFIRAGIPVLLVGPTGTGKTATAEHYLQQVSSSVYKFNFSSETKREHLLGHVMLDPQFGLNFHYGPYTKAYRDGSSLILDELNLASEDVLQCIEASLDTDELVIENPTKKNGIEVIRRNKEFKLIATQNPPSDVFHAKRYNLTSKLKSKFEVITYQPMSSIELKAIAQSILGTQDEFIDRLVRFHQMMAVNTDSKRPITIRDFKSVINAVNDGIDINKAIVMQYGAGLTEKSNNSRKKSFETIMSNLGFNPNPEMPSIIGDYFHNKSIEKALLSINFLLERRQPVLIVGKEGSGKSFAARTASEIFSGREAKTIVCTPETTIADLIGNYVPVPGHTDDDELPVQWFNSALVRAMYENGGEPFILDEIDGTPAQVVERLNPLFDSFFSGEFTINEHTADNKENVVKIGENFRLIATASEENLANISPALLNRFTIVSLNNQIPVISGDILTNIFMCENGGSLTSARTVGFSIASIIREERLNPSISAIMKIGKGISRVVNSGLPINETRMIGIAADIFLRHKIPKFGEDLLRKITGDARTDKFPKFYFETEEIHEVIAALRILRIMGQSVILQGNTGLGKTTCAMAFASILNTNNSPEPWQKLSFNRETKVSDLYGNISISGGKFANIKGPLQKCLTEGTVFIADEINLAEPGIIDSLTPALEGIDSKNLCLPGSNVPVDVSEGFFFIGCQNDTEMFGRKTLPPAFRRKIIELEYPYPNKIQSLINNIITDENCEISQCSNFIVGLMNSMRQHKLFKIRPWSFREVRKFLRRLKATSYLLTNDVAIPAHSALMIWSTVPQTKNNAIEIARLITSIKNNASLLKQIQELLLNDVKVNFENNNVTLKKGPVLLTLEGIPHNVPSNIGSYWNAMFLMKMAEPTEPLLLVGPTSFKSFLATNVSGPENSSIVHLNSDSTTSMLIGQTTLSSQAALINYLIGILGSIARPNRNLCYLIKLLQNSFNGTENELVKLQMYVTRIKNEFPRLGKVAENVHVGIIHALKDKSNALLKEYTSAFKPGLILQKVLQQMTIIMKNFTTPPVAVTERLNELLAIEPELTVTEDYTNTIVPSSDPVIRPGSSFRIIATCHPNELKQLSEAMLSRLSIIHVGQYTNDELAILQKTDLFKRNSLYSMFGLYLGKNSRNPTAQLEGKARALFNNHNQIPISEDHTKSPVIVNEMMASLYGIDSFSCILERDPIMTSRILYTPTIQRMISASFLALSAHFPLIISAPNGVGKTEAIRHVCGILGYDRSKVLTINLSRTTTFETLFGHSSISTSNGVTQFDFQRTPLANALCADSFNNQQFRVIILEEMNLAPSAVIEALIPVFNFDTESQILLPNGDTVPKSSCIVIGTSTRPLTSEITRRALYYEGENYTSQEFQEICEFMATKHQKDTFEFDPSSIAKTLTQLRDLSIEKQPNYAITLRQFQRFLDLQSIIPYKLLIKAIGSSAFRDEATRNDVTNQLTPEASEFLPIPTLIGGSRINIGGILVDLSSENEFFVYQNTLRTLTEDERSLMIFLAANTHKRYPLIIEGGTASGKTHTVQLFARLVGHPLVVIQMNSDSSASLITGGFNLSAQVKDESRNEILKLMDTRREVFQNIINVYQPLAKWKISDLRTIMRLLTKPEYNGVSDICEKINKVISNAAQLFNSLEATDSPIVSAMKNGSWILLDGIESAQADVIDRLTPLLSDNPRLDLFESDENIVYSRENGNIHKDFRLFMTYNNVGSHRRTMISNTIISRCVICSMRAIDSTDLSSSLIEYSMINDVQISSGFSDPVELSSMIGSLHSLQKKRESGADLTGRTLINIGKCLMSERSIQKELVKNTLMLHYCKEKGQEKGFNEDMNNEVDAKLIEEMREITKLENEDSSVFKKYIEECKDSISGFRLKSFSELFVKVHFEDFDDVIPSIKNLIDVINKSPLDINHRSCLIVIIRIFLYYMEEIISLTSDEELKKMSFVSPAINMYEGCKRIRQKIDFLIEEINVNRSLSLPSFFIDGNYISKNIQSNQLILVFRNLPLIAMIPQDFSSLYPNAYGPFYIAFKEVYEAGDYANASLLRSFYITYLSAAITKEQTKVPRDIIHVIPIDTVLMLNRIGLNFISFKNVELTALGIEISRRVEEYAENIKTTANFKENFAMKDWILTRIRENNACAGLYKRLMELAEKSTKNVRLYILEAFKYQIEKHNQAKVNFFSRLTLATEQSEIALKSDWFIPLVKYSFNLYLIEKLSDEDFLFYAVLILSDSLVVSQVFDSILEGRAITRAQKNSLKLVNAQTMISNLFEISTDYIIPGKMIEFINSTYDIKAPLDLSWKQTIEEVMELMPPDTEISIPEYNQTTVIDLIRTKVPEIPVQIKISNLSELIKELEKIRKEENKEKINMYIDLVNEYLSSQIEAELITDDADSFKDIEKFFNNHVKLASFVYMNNDIMNKIENCIKPSTITIGLIIARLYSSQQQFHFENYPIIEIKKELHQTIDEFFQYQIFENPRSSKALMVAAMMEHPPIKLQSYYPTVLRDIILIIVKSAGDGVLAEYIKAFLDGFLKNIFGDYSKATWERILNNDDELKNAALSPLRVFVNYANQQIYNNSENYQQKIQSAEEDLNKAMNDLQTVLAELQAAAHLDSINSYIKFEKEKDITPAQNYLTMLNFYIKYSMIGASFLSSATHVSKSQSSHLNATSGASKLYEIIESRKVNLPYLKTTTIALIPANTNFSIILEDGQEKECVSDKMMPTIIDIDVPFEDIIGPDIKYCEFSYWPLLSKEVMDLGLMQSSYQKFDSYYQAGVADFKIEQGPYDVMFGSYSADELVKLLNQNIEIMDILKNINKAKFRDGIIEEKPKLSSGIFENLKQMATLYSRHKRVYQSLINQNNLEPIKNNFTQFLNFSSKESIDLNLQTIKGDHFGFPAIVNDKGTLKVTTPRIEINIRNIPRYLYTKPLKVGIFLVGGVNGNPIVLSDDPLFIPTIEQNLDVIYLCFPIADLTNDIIYSGQFWIGDSPKIEFKIVYNFTDFPLVLESPTNVFKMDPSRNLYALNIKLYKGEITRFLVHPANDLAQNIPINVTYECIDQSNTPQEPRVGIAKGGIILDYQNNNNKKTPKTKFTLYASPKLKIPIFSERLVENRPLHVKVFDPRYKQFYQQFVIPYPIGQFPVTFKFFIGVCLKHEELEPEIEVKSDFLKIHEIKKDSIPNRRGMYFMSITVSLKQVIFVSMEGTLQFQVKIPFNEVFFYEFKFNNNNLFVIEKDTVRYISTGKKNTDILYIGKDGNWTDKMPKLEHFDSFVAVNSDFILVKSKPGVLGVRVDYSSQSLIDRVDKYYQDRIELFGIDSHGQCNILHKEENGFKVILIRVHQSSKGWFPAYEPEKLKNFIMEKIPRIRQLEVIDYIFGFARTEPKIRTLQSVVKFIEDRYNYLKKNNFYLNLPVPWETISMKQKELWSTNNKMPSEEELRLEQNEFDIPTNHWNPENGFKYIVLNKESVNATTEEALSNYRVDEQIVEKKYDFEEIDIDFNPSKALIHMDERTPKLIFDAFMRATSACRILPAFVRTDPMKARELFQNMYRFYSWNKKNDSIPFIIEKLKFMSTFEGLVRMLRDHGAGGTDKIELELDTEEFVVLPSQELPNVSNYQKPWRAIKKINEIILKKHETTTYYIGDLNAKQKSGVTSIEAPSGGYKSIQVERPNNGPGTQLFKINPESSNIVERLIETIQKGVPIECREEEDLNHKKPIFDNKERSSYCIDPYIKAAKPLAASIVSHARESQAVFFKTDFVVLMDVSASIEQNRLAVLTAAIGTSIALEELKVPFSIVIFADVFFQYTFKRPEEPLVDRHIQLLVDAMQVIRRISFLESAIKFTENDIKRKIDFARRYFVFSDGLFPNMIAKRWSPILRSDQMTIDCIVFPELKPDQLSTYKKSVKRFSNETSRKINFTIIENPTEIFQISMTIPKLFDAYQSEHLEDDQMKSVHSELLNNVDVNDHTSPSLIETGNEFFVQCNKELQYAAEIHPRVFIHNPVSFEVGVTGSGSCNISGFKQFSANSAILSSFYTPNQATQYSPSERGTAISIMGLVKFYITEGHEKKIYLEKNAGFVASYSMYVVIDCSSSCFSYLTRENSIATIFATLSSLSNLEGQPLTVVLAMRQAPVCLYIDAMSSDLLSPSSSLWKALMHLVQSTYPTASFADALEVVRELRTRQSTQRSYVYAFTDGEIPSEDAHRVISLVTALETLNTDVIGVGIGFVPVGIEKIFRSCFWAAKTKGITTCLRKLAAGENAGKIVMPPQEQLTVDFLAKIKEDLNHITPVYMELIDYARKHTIASISNMVMYNETIFDEDLAGKLGIKIKQIPSKSSKEMGPSAAKPGDEASKEKRPLPNKPSSGGDKIDKSVKEKINTAKYDLGCGKVWKFKILFIQFYDSSMNPNERETTSFSTLVGKDGVVNALRELGITVEIVQNYREAIVGLASGEFSEAWIVCGRGDRGKPNTRTSRERPAFCANIDALYKLPKNTEDCDLVLQFVDTLEIFRQKGGGVFFAADDHFTFELDHYLDIASFTISGDRVVQMPIRFHLSDQGEGKLNRNNISYRIPLSFDDRQEIRDENITRKLPGYNVLDLYEGTTIACADLKDFGPRTPFKPFSFSTLGLVSNAIYLSPVDCPAGDMIIDGASSKLFNELNEEGVRRQVKNTAVVLTGLEKKIITVRREEDAVQIRPPKFDIPPLRSAAGVEFYSFSASLDIVFLVDSTNSMKREDFKFKSPLVEAAKSMVETLTSNSKTIAEKRGYKIRFGAVFFRDLAMAKLHLKNSPDSKQFKEGIMKNQTEIRDFGEFNISDFDTIESRGGCGDGPEDWVSAFKGANSLSWKEGSKRLAVMITDSGGHGASFNNAVYKVGATRRLENGNIEKIGPQEVERKNNDKAIIDRKEGPKLMKELQELAEKEVDLVLISANKDAVFGFDNLKSTYGRDVEITNLNFQKQKANAITKILNEKITQVVDNIVMAGKIDGGGKPRAPKDHSNRDRNLYIKGKNDEKKPVPAEPKVSRRQKQKQAAPTEYRPQESFGFRHPTPQIYPQQFAQFDPSAFSMELNPSMFTPSMIQETLPNKSASNKKKSKRKGKSEQQEADDDWESLLFSDPHKAAKPVSAPQRLIPQPTTFQPQQPTIFQPQQPPIFQPQQPAIFQPQQPTTFRAPMLTPMPQVVPQKAEKPKRRRKH